MRALCLLFLVLFQVQLEAPRNLRVGGMATFGNTNQASSVLTSKYGASYFQAPENGTLESISVCLEHGGGSEPDYINLGIYNGDSTHITTHIAHGVAVEINVASKNFYTVSVTANLVAGNYYWLIYQGKAAVAARRIFYQSGSGLAIGYSSVIGWETWSDNPSPTFSANQQLSMYATYTPAAGGASIPVDKRGVMLGMNVGMNRGMMR
jgi:hypothetical protein